MMAAMIGLCAPRPAGRHWPHPCVFRFNASRGGTMWHDQKYLHDNKKRFDSFDSQDLVNHSGDTVFYNVIHASPTVPCASATHEGASPHLSPT